MQANSSSRTKAICFGYIQTAIQTQRVREDEFACKYSSPTDFNKKGNYLKVTPFVFYVVEILSVLFLGYVAARKKNIFASQIKERRNSGRRWLTFGC